MSHEAISKISSVNQLQENEQSYGGVSIKQSSLLLKKVHKIY